jgi:mono/diheme cytochrome c family protein
MMSFAGANIAAAETGPFTQQQAEAGHTLFNNNCAQCHRPDLSGATGPALKDSKFKDKYAGKPVAELRSFILEQMPKNAPHSLTDDKLDPIVAYILSKNSVAPGDKPLSKETAGAPFPKQ